MNEFKIDELPVQWKVNYLISCYFEKVAIFSKDPAYLRTENVITRVI